MTQEALEIRLARIEAAIRHVAQMTLAHEFAKDARNVEIVKALVNDGWEAFQIEVLKELHW